MTAKFLRVVARILICVLVCLTSMLEAVGQTAEDEVAELTVEEKVGRMILAGFDGYDPSSELELLVREWGVGGVVFYGRNLADDDRTKALTSWIIATAVDAPLIAIDQEGGIVRRLGDPFPSVPSAMALGAADDQELAYYAGNVVGRCLRDLGFNMNFAPVLDLLSEPRNEAIGTRALGDDPERVARIGAAFIGGQERAGVVSVAKHFPGQGRASEDTHKRPVALDVSLEELSRTDLVPFRTAIENGLPAVMTTHASFPLVTGDRVPASLSSRITTILRDDLGFEGVVISDALEMYAAIGARSPAEQAIASISAGADMVLLLGTLARKQHIRNELIRAVREGRLEMARVDEAVRRIDALRRITSRDHDGCPGTGVVGRIARASVAASPTFRAVARDSLDEVVYLGPAGELSRGFRNVRALERRSEAGTIDGTLLRLVEEAPLWVGAADNDDQYRLILALHRAAPEVPVIFVNLGHPFRWITGPNASTLWTWSEHAESQRAALRVIQGALEARGILPVKLEGELEGDGAWAKAGD